jgi:hypothetical protein
MKAVNPKNIQEDDRMKKHRGVLVLLVAAVFAFTFCLATASFAQKKFDENKEISTGTAEATGEKAPPSKKDKVRSDKAKMDKAGKKFDENKEISSGTEEATGEKAPAKKAPKGKAKVKKGAKKADENQEISTGREDTLNEKDGKAPAKAPAKK